MIATVTSVAVVGYDGRLVQVESDMKQGLPGLQIVGLANKAIDEARQRVRSALTNSELDFPARKLTVNLAPANLPKNGSHFDVPIALSLLISSGQLRARDVAGSVFVGELSLSGEVRQVRGVVSMAEAARRHHFSTLFVPMANRPQARLIDGIEIIGVNTLKDLYLHLKKVRPIPHPTDIKKAVPSPRPEVTLDAIAGQDQAKRALLIAAAGRHNLLFQGPPGTGKTLLAKALHSLLPPLSTDEVIAVMKLHSLSDDLDGTVTYQRPFRSPHHSASRTALIGGGSHPLPGEISLAHYGVLFLDELPEYPRTVLEALRQPLEDRQIHLSRTDGRITYPADCMLVATMNPCPCGYLGDTAIGCTCSPGAIESYKRRISGPLLDRIDITLTVSRQPPESIFTSASLTNTQHLTAVELIKTARTIQQKRYNSSTVYNATVPFSQVQDLVFTREASEMLTTAARRLHLSSRGCFKVMKIARTIADLDDMPRVEAAHIAEALQFRSTLYGSPL